MVSVHCIALTGGVKRVNDFAEHVNDFETPAEQIYCRVVVRVCGWPALEILVQLI